MRFLLPLSKTYQRHPIRSAADDTSDMVFLLGSGRNGSTLLASILNEHEQAVAVPEQFFLYMSFVRFQLFGAKSWAGLVSTILEEASARKATAGWQSDFRPLINELKKTEKPKRSLSYLLKCMYLHYADSQEKRHKVVMDKTPMNSQHVPMLLELFPDARFVFLNRDGRDVVNSYMKGSSEVFDEMHELEEASRFWLHCLGSWDMVKAEIPDDRRHEMRYEDLVTDPTSTLAGLLGFLGLPEQEGLLSFQSQHSTMGVSDMEHHQNLKRPLMSDSIGKYRRDLDADSIQRIEDIIRPGLIAADYMPSGH